VVQFLGECDHIPALAADRLGLHSALGVETGCPKNSAICRQQSSEAGSIWDLDSGLRSRLYDFFVAFTRQIKSATMQIGEVARRASLTVDAIRFYERRRLLPKAERTAGKFRLYSMDAVERLRFIQQMQGLGFSLKEVGELLQLRERKVDACESVKELLETKLADVRSKLSDLKQLEAELVSDLRKCNRELSHRRRHAPSPCPVLEEAGGQK